MTKNVFEDQVEEYLRYNGFFTIRDYVIHIELKQAQEIDFVGVRLPHSIEQTLYANGHFSNFVFKDDYEKFALNKPQVITLLIAEVTESVYGQEIKKRIDYLRDKIRIGYALQRLGINDRGYVNSLMENKIVEINGITNKLIRILFVLNDNLAKKYEKQNNDLRFISQKYVLMFIKKRAKIDLKKRARTLLPPWLHNEINLLLQR